MKIEKIIDTLKNSNGCHNCIWGCFNPYRCDNYSCPYRNAIVALIDNINICYTSVGVSEKYEDMMDRNYILDIASGQMADYIKDHDIIKYYETRNDDAIGINKFIFRTPFIKEVDDE